MKQNKDFDKSLLLLIVIVAITIVTALSLYMNVRVDKISQIIKSKELVKILIAVEDNDSLLLSQVLLINTETNKGALIDVPNNIGTIVKTKNRYSKIESVYTDYGVEAYRNKVGEILALDIPFHITIDKSEFSELIDFYDGLDLFISKSLEDKDILIPTGSVVLGGDKVLQYLELNSVREHKADKSSRRQKVLQAFLTQMKKYSSSIVLENNYQATSSRIKSNLDINSLKKFIEFLGLLEVERLVLQGILGEPKTVSGEELIYPYNSENLIKVRIKRILITLNNPEVISDEKLNFNIQVLNGTNNPGLAKRTADYLSSFGYNISGVGNADRGDDEHENTAILIRKGNTEASQSLGELINCKYIYPQAEEGIDDTIDFTIILGKDFDGKRCKD